MLLVIIKRQVLNKIFRNELADLQYLATDALQLPLVFQVVWSIPTHLLALHCLA